MSTTTIDEVLKAFETKFKQIIGKKDKEIKALKARVRDLERSLEIEAHRFQFHSFDINHFLGNSNFNKIASTIWSYFDRESLKKCRLVCKSWNVSILQNFDVFWAAELGYEYEYDSLLKSDDYKLNLLINRLCKYGRTETMRLILPSLIKMSYPINRDEIENDGESLKQRPYNPLSHACLNGHFGLAQLLIDNAKDLRLNLNHIYNETHTWDYIDCDLLEIKAADYDYGGTKHGTILHLAVRGENVEAVRFLLGTNIDINLDKHGRGT